jgi:hypothetical protein
LSNRDQRINSIAYKLIFSLKLKMHSHQFSLAPHNPSSLDLEFHMEGKHRELRGFLSHFDQTTKNEWIETATKSNIRVSHIPSLSKERFMSRRVDYTINAEPEKVVKMASDIKYFYKIMKNVESVK